MFAKRFDPTMPPAREPGDASYCARCPVDVDAGGSGEIVGEVGAYDQRRCTACGYEWLALTDQRMAWETARVLGDSHAPSGDDATE